MNFYFRSWRSVLVASIAFLILRTCYLCLFPKFKTVQYSLTFQIFQILFCMQSENFSDLKKKKFKSIFFLHFFTGLWRATVWRRTFSVSYKLHGQVSNSCWYTPNKTAVIRGSVYVVGIQIKRNKPFNLRQAGHLHRQIHNIGRTEGECRRCQPGRTPPLRESCTCSLTCVRDLHTLRNLSVIVTTCCVIQSRFKTDKLGYYQYICIIYFS